MTALPHLINWLDVAHKEFQTYHQLQYPHNQIHNSDVGDLKMYFNLIQETEAASSMSWWQETYLV